MRRVNSGPAFFIPSIEKGGEGFPRIGLQCLSLFNKKYPGSTHGHNTATPLPT